VRSVDSTPVGARRESQPMLRYLLLSLFARSTVWRMESHDATIERVERALASLWKRQCRWMPGGRSRDVGSATLVMTDCVSESLRGPVLYLVDSDVSLVDRALEHAASSGRGLVVDLMGSQRANVAEHLHRRGFERTVSRQLMIVDPRSVSGVPEARLARSDQLDAIRLIQRDSFQMSDSDTNALYPLSIMEVEDTELVVVCDDNAVVATATVHHGFGMVGLFGVACDPGQRGRGFGKAATVGAVARAESRDEDLCWLQAADDVAPFYERLGFETIDTCDVWSVAYV